MAVKAPVGRKAGLSGPAWIDLMLGERKLIYAQIRQV
jgi:hypothetical protein